MLDELCGKGTEPLRLRCLVNVNAADDGRFVSKTSAGQDWTGAGYGNVIGSILPAGGVVVLGLVACWDGVG